MPPRRPEGPQVTPNQLGILRFEMSFLRHFYCPGLPIRIVISSRIIKRMATKAFSKAKLPGSVDIFR